MVKRVYDWDTCPNIDLLDKGVVWWNEDYICIDKALSTAGGSGEKQEVKG